MRKTKCLIAGQVLNSFRFGFDEDDYRCKNLKLKLLEQMSILYENGIRLFLSDCSLGVSMWSAEIAIGLITLHPDTELVCVIPYEEQATKWPKEYRERYFYIHENCTRSVLLSTSYTANCLIDCYQYLVFDSDVLLAVCDQNDTGFDKVGYMVSYAKNIDRSIIYIHPETLDVTPTIFVT